MSIGHVAFVKAAGGFRYIHPFTFEGYHYMQKAGVATERMMAMVVQKHINRAISMAGLG
jgi:hypothetical protein